MFEQVPPSRRFIVYVFTFIASIFAIFIFISSGISKLQTKKYVIYFDNAISGLQVGNLVYIKGVPIGLVDSINIEFPDGQRVQVVIKIDKKIVLYDSCKAKIGMQGLTGHSIIELSNKKGQRELVRLQKNIPEIPSESSIIDKLFDDIPQLIVNANELVKNLNKMVKTNKRKVGVILDSVATTLDNINKSAQGLLHISGKIEEKWPLFEDTLGNLNGILKTWNTFSNSSMLELMDLINNLNNITTNINDGINSNRGYLGYLLGV